MQEMFPQEQTKTQTYKDYTLTVNDPYGLVTVEKNEGRTPTELVQGTYTAVSEARKAIDAYNNKIALLKQEPKKEVK